MSWRAAPSARSRSPPVPWPVAVPSPRLLCWVQPHTGSRLPAALCTRVLPPEQVRVRGVASPGHRLGSCLRNTHRQPPTWLPHVPPDRRAPGFPRPPGSSPPGLLEQSTAEEGLKRQECTRLAVLEARRPRPRPRPRRRQAGVPPRPLSLALRRPPSRWFPARASWARLPGV